MSIKGFTVTEGSYESKQDRELNSKKKEIALTSYYRHNLVLNLIYI